MRSNPKWAGISSSEAAFTRSPRAFVKQRGPDTGSQDAARGTAKGPAEERLGRTRPWSVRPFLHLLNPTRRPRQESFSSLLKLALLLELTSMRHAAQRGPRSHVPAPRQSKRSAPACWRAERSEYCDAIAVLRRRATIQSYVLPNLPVVARWPESLG